MKITLLFVVLIVLLLCSCATEPYPASPPPRVVYVEPVPVIVVDPFYLRYEHVYRYDYMFPPRHWSRPEHRPRR